MPVIERALETTALMLGSDKSPAYYLQVICAAFLARAPETLLFSMTRFFGFGGGGAGILLLFSLQVLRRELALSVMRCDVES
jgi:hypothetical protein